MSEAPKPAPSHRLGRMAMASSLCYTLVGLPSQMWKIWVRQSAADVSILLFALMVVNATIWLSYALEMKNRFMIIPNIAILTLSVTIIVECLWFGGVRF